MNSQYSSLLTSSHLDIKVPLTPISFSTQLSQILNADSRRTLFFDENVSLFVIFKIPVDLVDANQLDSFLKETLLTLEVAVTDAPRQSDSGVRREKFEGTVVHTTSVLDDCERTKEEIDGQWLVAWNLIVPIKHSRTKVSSPRVALTAILSLSSTHAEKLPDEDFITADSWNALSGQRNLLAPLADDPTISVAPFLPLNRIISTNTSQPAKVKPGRRICRHIFSCGSPIDIRMRYNPIEPADSSINTEIVLLSVYLSVTPHAGANVLIKDVKVEMAGGTIIPLQEVPSYVLKRYDVLTLLFRYERYGGDGTNKTVSTNITMVPLLSGIEETSPKITSLWNKTLDIPTVNSSPPVHFTSPTAHAVGQIMSVSSNRTSHSAKPSITGKPRGITTGHGRAHTVIDIPSRPPSMAISATEPPNLSITVTVPSGGTRPNEEFSVSIQVVNRATRPIKLAVHVDSSRVHQKTQSRTSRTDKNLPRAPSSQPNYNSNPGSVEDSEILELYHRERDARKGKGIIALSVEEKIGTLLPGQVQSVSCLFLALTPGIHEITDLRIVELLSADTPPGANLVIKLTSCPLVVVHGGRY